ncbi:YlbE-like family protein [Salirhabdus sp. Marseille-P4669]|uniref:YlbE-like family protein n=1 Tax=Salirhabdus sp. Marseille-P4669 TaxID=2042310 RepID=UPI000C7E0CC0|nr:YlbE-like family protein [Salirhabdus sp. Marseille-P4669]
MDGNVYRQLQNRPDLIHFIRMNPIWYRRLTRYPEMFQALESSSKHFYGKTFYQRVGKANDRLNMLMMLLSMAEAMQEQQE